MEMEQAAGWHNGLLLAGDASARRGPMAQQGRHLAEHGGQRAPGRSPVVPDLRQAQRG